jgi:hypothetical protein
LTETTTDPAREIALVIDWMQSLAPSERPIWEVLYSGIPIEGGNAEFLELAAALSTRVQRLRTLCTTLVEPDFEEDMRSRTDQALARFDNVLAPGHLHRPWTAARDEWAQPSDATWLRTVGSIIRRHQPLRLVSGEEREALLKMIEEAIADLYSDAELAGWGREALVIGLRRMYMVLRYFQFFGHEATVREIVLGSGPIKGIHRDVSV